MAEGSREGKERATRITLSFGSLLTDRKEGGLYVVYDVGLPRHPGPPLKTCHILTENPDLLAWSGSMYPYEVGSVLERVWPEERLIEAFMHSYHLPLTEVMEVVHQIENRGPRIFTV